MSFSLSNISGSQIQKDSFINNLTVACDPGLLAPKNLNGLPNPLNLEKRDGKSAIAVDICCLDLACLNVTEKLTVNDATFNTLFASFLTADNANIDTLEGRVVNLKASNAVGAPGGAAKLTIGDTAAGDAMGGDTAIEIVGTNQNIDAINLATGGNITMEQQGPGSLDPLATLASGGATDGSVPNLALYIAGGANIGTNNVVNAIYALAPTVGANPSSGGRVWVSTSATGEIVNMTAESAGIGYLVGQQYEIASGTVPINVGSGTAAPTIGATAVTFLLPGASTNGPGGGVLTVYQVNAQFISGTVQGQVPSFAPTLAQINSATSTTTFPPGGNPLYVNYLEISSGNPGTPGAIVAQGNTTGTPDAGGNIINILNPVFIESQTNQGLLVAGGIQAGSAPAFGGAYGFQVSNQGAISAPGATITGTLQTETLNVNGNTTLGDGVGVDTLTVNAVSTFNDEVTIDNQLAVTSLSELSNVEITGSLQQSGGIVTLAGPNVTVNTSLTVTGGLLTANAGLTVNGGLLQANNGLTVVGTSTLATTNIATLTVAGTSALIGQVTVTNNLILLPTSTLEIQNTNFNAFGVAGNAVQVSGGVGIGATLWVTQGIRSNGNINTTGNITASLNIKGSFVESTGNLQVGGISTLTGDVIVNSLTNSSSPATGALTVDGGVGIGGNLFTNAAVNIGAGLIVADNITSSGLTSSGIVGITDTTGSTSTATGALTVAGGVGIAENLWLGGDLDVGGAVSFANLTLTGNLVVQGTTNLQQQMNGTVGIFSGALTSAQLTVAPSVPGTFVVGNTGVVVINNTNNSNQTALSGALACQGGASISQDLFVGGSITNVVGQNVTIQNDLELIQGGIESGQPVIIQGNAGTGIATTLTIGTLGGVPTTGIFSNAPVVIGSSSAGNGLTVGSGGTPQDTLMNGNLEVTGGIGIGNAPGAAGTLSVQNLSTFTGGIATNSLGVIGGPGTAVSITGNVDILSSGELTVDSITSNAGQNLAISPVAGQDLNISASGGGQVNIATGGEVSLGGKVKVALTPYDSDTAAGLAGVVTGELYQTSGAGAALPFNFPGIVMVKQ